MEAATISRHDLYELVWQIPRSKLASRFGISDVALAKRCRKLQIPMPGPGYWARIAAGQKPPKKKLPKAPPGAETEIVFGASVSEQRASEPLPDVPVTDELVDPHPAVTWLASAFKKATPDEYDRYRVGLSFHPDVCVRKPTIQRALLILDALFKVLEARGHSVEARPSESQHGPEREILLLVFGQPFTLQVEEKLRQQPHEPTKHELSEQAKAPWYKPRKWDQVPEGDILLRLARGGHYLFTGRTTWSDTKVQALDSQLGRAVVEIESIGEFMRSYREEEEARALARREHERRHRRGERLDWWRGKLTEDLERMARDWRQAQHIRDFLDAYSVRTQAIDLPAFGQRWLEATRRYAEALDPLSSLENVPKDLDPSDELLERALEEEQRAASKEATRPR